MNLDMFMWIISDRGRTLTFSARMLVVDLWLFVDVYLFLLMIITLPVRIGTWLARDYPMLLVPSWSQGLYIAVVWIVAIELMYGLHKYGRWPWFWEATKWLKRRTTADFEQDSWSAFDE